MDLPTAILCDYAQVREGLLFVVSGGVTRLWRAELPAPMHVHLALVVELDALEAAAPHTLRVEVVDADGGPVVNAELTFKSEAPPAGEAALVPIVLDLRDAPLRTYGAHEARISIDGNAVRTLAFVVAHR